jgi:hypothetical protein
MFLFQEDLKNSPLGKALILPMPAKQAVTNSSRVDLSHDRFDYCTLTDEGISYGFGDGDGCNKVRESVDIGGNLLWLIMLMRRRLKSSGLDIALLFSLSHRIECRYSVGCGGTVA